MKFNRISQALLLSSILSVSSLTVVAAEVPQGVKLAKEQTLVRGNGSEVESLDPHKVSGVPESIVLRDLLEGLVNQDKDGHLIPGVAESWETKDNKVWTFTLRKNAKWSNGDSVTAKDFVFAWQRLIDPNTASPYASYMVMTTMQNATDILSGKKKPDTLGVKAVDDYTLQVTLEKALPYFVNMTNHTALKPVHKATVEKYGDRWTTPENYVSNGAYQLNKWVVNERLVFDRNENYWDNAHTVINQVTYLPIESYTDDMNRFKAGEVDMTYEVPNEQFKTLQKNYPDNLKVTPNLCNYYYEFNLAKKPFDDIRVRQALAYALDREVIAKRVVGKGEIEAYSFTPPSTNGLKAATPDYATLTQAERIKKAKALLEEAGYGPSNPLEFDLLYNTNENHKKIAVAVGALWKQALGVKVSLNNQEWKSYLSSRREGNFEVARGGWCGDYNEASTFIGIFETGHTQNYPKYSSKAYDNAVQSALKATSDETRSEFYQQAQSILTNDMPIIPVYHYVKARLVASDVGGYSMNNIEDNIYTKDLYKIAE